MPEKSVCAWRPLDTQGVDDSLCTRRVDQRGFLNSLAALRDHVGTHGFGKTFQYRQSCWRRRLKDENREVIPRAIKSVLALLDLVSQAEAHERYLLALLSLVATALTTPCAKTGDGLVAI